MHCCKIKELLSGDSLVRLDQLCVTAIQHKATPINSSPLAVATNLVLCVEVEDRPSEYLDTEIYVMIKKTIIVDIKIQNTLR